MCFLCSDGAHGEGKTMTDKAQGFFVKLGDHSYSEPFASLGEARSEARSKGPDLEIYHGILKYISDSVVDDKELYLIPKYEK
jgi:hypothetical protein